MVEKDKLVELMQEYLFAAKELHDYTASEGMDTPCGFSATDPIHMYCTPETYGALSKLFDPGSYHAKPVATPGACFEFATIGGMPIKIFWNANEWKEVYKQWTL